MRFCCLPPLALILIEKYVYIMVQCIGYKLAMEEGILALAKVMQRFDLELDLEKHQGPLEVLAGITLVPKDGVWVQFYPRRTEEA